MRLLKALPSRDLVVVLLLGVASGLPSPLVFGNLSIWLRELGVSRTDIGLLAIAASPYALNFLWAPLLDRHRPPLFARLGQRRGWALSLQVALVASILLWSTRDPGDGLLMFATMALLIASLSATQDIAIDAWRIDAIARDRQGSAAAYATVGWHLGGTLLGGAGGLYIADAFGWGAAWRFTAVAMLIGMLGVLLAHEPERESAPEQQEGAQSSNPFKAAYLAIKSALLEPARELLSRKGIYLLLFFIVIFRLGDAMLGKMAHVFYVDLGFQRAEIAEISKIYGLSANIAGVMLGGVVARWLGLTRALLLSGIFSASTNLTYMMMATAGHERGPFIFAVVANGLTTGLVTVAFVGFLSTLCARQHAATHYALLASLGNLGRLWFAAGAGWMVDKLDGDWSAFFVWTTVIALLGIPLLIILARKYPNLSQG